MTDLRKILSRLDIDQKIAQVQGIVPMDMISGDSSDDSESPIAYDVTRVSELRPHGVGHLSLAGQLAPHLEDLRTELKRFQDAAREVTPFGIEVLVHAEGISGLVHPQGHQFTTAWGQAATWNPTVPRTVGDIAARQSRDLGIHVLFSPLLDISRDIRWGRVHETYGEDAELVTRMGVAFIQGVEGATREGGVLATGKHFLGYGHSLGGLNQASTQLGRRELIDVYAEPFRRAIAEASLSIVMPSYNDIDGIPAVSNPWLLKDLLRDQLGFEGLVVSDYGAFSMLWTTFRTARTAGQAAAQALTAGLDVELPSNATTASLRSFIESGAASEEALDRAVLNVLTIKHRLGLVPGVVSGRTFPDRPAGTKIEATRAARLVANEAVTVLANDGVLPLLDGRERLAVVGPAAHEIRIHFGAYTSVSDDEMPVAVQEILAGNVPGIEASPDVLPDMFQTRLPGVEPLFEQGARRLHPEAMTVADAVRAIDPSATFHPFGSFTNDADALDTAALLSAVADADTVIAVVGERTGWFGNHTAGEGRTVADPTLPGNQNELVTELAAAGKRVVTVVVTGRPLLLETVNTASAAIVLAPLLGPLAGETIADVLFGLVEPSGRTPSTFPRAGGQTPLYHGHPIGSGYDHPELVRYGYADLADSTPLFPFGHGLSYTTFELSLLDARTTDGIIEVDVSVRNTGPRHGTAVVQLYARHDGASVVRPVRQLLDFGRVPIDPESATTVSLAAPIARLTYTWPDGQRGVEAGSIKLLLGFSSADIAATATLDVPRSLIYE